MRCLRSFSARRLQRSLLPQRALIEITVPSRELLPAGQLQAGPPMLAWLQFPRLAGAPGALRAPEPGLQRGLLRACAHLSRQR